MNLKKLGLARDTAKRLKILRQQLGYTQPQMAKYLGITASGYRKNEGGENIPHLSILHRLFNEHNISMDWFLFGKGPMHHAGPKIQEQEKRIRELENEVQRLTRQLENETGRLNHELETVNEKYRQDNEKLQRILEQTEGLRGLGADVKELVAYMKNDPELYHDLMLHFHRNKKERPQQPKKTKPV